MIPLSLSELATITQGELVGDDLIIESVSTDSRRLGQVGLFIALKGERFDGHDFVQKAIKSGAKALLVSTKQDEVIPQLIVADTEQAMGQIAAAVKERLALKSVALTGSNGKTTVKEMVATILSQYKSPQQVLYTAGNFNNEIGVPLTLLRLEAEHGFGVFELGANHKGEIDYTSSLVCPDVALVNNVASAHLEGFGSLDGVASAKSEIFNHLNSAGVAVINADDPYADVMRSAAASHQQLSYSVGQSADLVATELQTDRLGRYSFNLNYQGLQAHISLPLPGKHQVANALAATAICLSLGLSIDEIHIGLTKLVPVKGRMFPTSLGRVQLIDDSYNANPASVGAAINYLETLSGQRYLILGDLGELGDDAPLLHQQLGQLAKEKGLEQLITLGELSEQASLSFGGKHYKDIDELVEQLILDINQIKGDITILVKGSRSARMERVVDALTDAFKHGELS